MSDAVLIAIVTGPAVLVIDRLITWLRNRSKDDAEAGLTIDERWQKLTDKYEARIGELEARVGRVEDDLRREQARAKGLEAEVDRYRSIARSLLRHVVKLRDALAKANAEVPEMPVEVENALTSIELP